MVDNFDKETARETLEKGYDQAEKVLKNEDKLESLFRKLEQKLKVVPKVGEYLSHIPVFASMIKSFVKKEYTEVPYGTIIAMVSAIIYFVSPIDIIPDFVPGAGYIDDAGVVLACLALVDSDIKDYLEWRDAHQ